MLVLYLYFRNIHFLRVFPILKRGCFHIYHRLLNASILIFYVELPYFIVVMMCVNLSATE